MNPMVCPKCGADRRKEQCVHGSGCVMAGAALAAPVKECLTAEVVDHCWKMYQQGQISADHTAKEVFAQTLNSLANWLATPPVSAQAVAPAQDDGPEFTVADPDLDALLNAAADYVKGSNQNMDTGLHLMALLERVEARLAPAQAEQEPVAIAGTMPGTSGFTMACFKAADVPVGSPLYTLPQAAQPAAQMAGLTASDELWKLVDAYADAREEYRRSTDRSLAMQQREKCADATEALNRAMLAAARQIATLHAVIAEQEQDASTNAPWLTQAHAICSDAGIPVGHITKRLEALGDLLAQRAGWQLVPEYPTEEMEVAFCEAWFSQVRCIDDPEMVDAYQDMLAAAPAASTGSGE